MRAIPSHKEQETHLVDSERGEEDVDASHSEILEVLGGVGETQGQEDSEELEE